MSVKTLVHLLTSMPSIKLEARRAFPVYEPKFWRNFQESRDQYRSAKNRARYARRVLARRDNFVEMARCQHKMNRNESRGHSNLEVKKTTAGQQQKWTFRAEELALPFFVRSP